MQLLTDLLAPIARPEGAGPIVLSLPDPALDYSRPEAQAMAGHYRDRIEATRKLASGSVRDRAVAEFAEALAAWEVEVARHPA